MDVPAARIFFPQEDIESIKEKIPEILSSGQLTLGKYGKELEEKFSKCIDTKHAVAVNSGTSAIEIPMRVFDVKNGNVIVPANTFFATPAAVLHAGGNVKFSDADPETLSIDTNNLNDMIDKKTKGVIVVHIAGIITSKIDEIIKICRDNNIFLFEDAAHAHGSSLNGKKAGSFGNAASFSFYPTKVITSAEGGIIVTDDDKVDEKSRIFRDQGKASFQGNNHIELGYNWRMSEVHALIGLHQFNRLEEFIEKRKAIATIYDKELKNLDKVKPLAIPHNSRSNYYKYIVMLEKGIDRNKLKEMMKERGVSLSGEVYDKPCHLQPVFKSLDYKQGDLPIAEDICSRHICLPIFPTMTKEQAMHVTESLKIVIENM